MFIACYIFKIYINLNKLDIREVLKTLITKIKTTNEKWVSKSTFSFPSPLKLHEKSNFPKIRTGSIGFILWHWSYGDKHQCLHLEFGWVSNKHAQGRESELPIDVFKRGWVG